MFAGLILTLANIILGTIEFLLSLRVILKFFGASIKAPFVIWLYETTQPLLTPFLGMFPSPRIDGRFILEASTLFAILAYAFLDVIIETVVFQLRPPTKVKEYQTR